MMVFFSNLHANNILVSNVSLVNRNTNADYVFVKFNISWENSFRISSGAANWDAAWIFVKYKIGDNGEWNHATLNTSGHTIPSNGSSTQNDATGIFLFRNADGNGTFSLNSVQLRWNYGADGVLDDAKIYVKVFAIEMVYIPEGSFQLGSGSQTEAGFRIANDVSSTGTATTYTITGSAPTLQGNNAASSASNLSNQYGIALDLGQTTNTATLANGYPTGFSAFYCMKYEITQGQYRDFLNTLTYNQQSARTTIAPNSGIGYGALVSLGTNRNGIAIQIDGTSTGNTFPAVYGCDLSGNAIFDEADDGEWIACNYLSWDDVAAFLDWAALRPITELEYEKIGRGTNSPVENEYSWGNTTILGLASLLNNNQVSEISNTSNANAVFESNFYSGPVRVGIFATATSNRTSSGSSYYGVMDMTGNVWEQVIKIENSTGRSFTGAFGNGKLATNGNANTANWPTYTGACKRGGSWATQVFYIQLSSRYGATLNGLNRDSETGGRGGR